MTVMEGLQLALEVLALLVLGLKATNRWAVANHADRLAMWTSAGANAAARIRLVLAELPATEDPAATRAALVKQAAEQVMREFNTTAPAISATAAKTEALILAHLAPPVAAPP